MNEPHKHAEIIKAWADGHDIQTRWKSTKTGEWTEWRDEEWNDVEFFYDHEYRIKPEPKPDEIFLFKIADEWYIRDGYWAGAFNCIDIEIFVKIDSKTGKMKEWKVRK